jgi:hypothetical protein
MSFLPSTKTARGRGDVERFQLSMSALAIMHSLTSEDHRNETRLEELAGERLAVE